MRHTVESAPELGQQTGLTETGVADGEDDEAGAGGRGVEAFAQLGDVAFPADEPCGARRVGGRWWPPDRRDECLQRPRLADLERARAQLARRLDPAGDRRADQDLTGVGVAEEALGERDGVA